MTSAERRHLERMYETVWCGAPLSTGYRCSNTATTSAGRCLRHDPIATEARRSGVWSWVCRQGGGKGEV